MGMKLQMKECSDCPLKKQIIEGLKLIAAGKRKIEEGLKY